MLVESSHGLVPIETLVVGDTVWAIDPQTNQAGYYPITWTTAHTATLVIALTVQPLTDTLGLAQEQILATDHHPFWVYGRGWIDAGKLRVGDRLLGDAGYTITVVNVDVELQPVMVYNFTVDTLHTYTIGHAGILVHNTGCDDLVNNTPHSLDDGYTYSPSVERKWIDIYHSFPRMLDDIIISKGPVLIRSDGRREFIAKGYLKGGLKDAMKDGKRVVNESEGIYHIGIWQRFKQSRAIEHNVK